MRSTFIETSIPDARVRILTACGDVAVGRLAFPCTVGQGKWYMVWELIFSVQIHKTYFSIILFGANQSSYKIKNPFDE